MPYISFIVACIASEFIKGFLLKAYGAALCIFSFTACLLKSQSILNFKGRFAFVSKSIPLVKIFRLILIIISILLDMDIILPFPLNRPSLLLIYRYCFLRVSTNFGMAV